MLPLEGDEVSGWKPGIPTPFLKTEFQESDASFSPDGRWVAYVSTESGSFDVYVRPFNGPEGTVRVSTDAGGIGPVWSRTKRELLFGTVTGQTMVAPYTVASTRIEFDKARLWSERRHVTRGPNRMFDLHPDGTRIALALTTPIQMPNRATFLFDFFDQLRAMAPIAHR